MGSSLELFDGGTCEDSLECSMDEDETSTEADKFGFLLCSIDDDESSLISDDSFNGAAALSSVQPQK